MAVITSRPVLATIQTILLVVVLHSQHATARLHHCVSLVIFLGPLGITKRCATWTAPLSLGFAPPEYKPAAA